MPNPAWRLMAPLAEMGMVSDAVSAGSKSTPSRTYRSISPAPDEATASTAPPYHPLFFCAGLVVPASKTSMVTTSPPPVSVVEKYTPLAVDEPQLALPSQAWTQ